MEKKTRTQSRSHSKSVTNSRRLRLNSNGKDDTSEDLDFPKYSKSSRGSKNLEPTTPDRKRNKNKRLRKGSTESRPQVSISVNYDFREDLKQDEIVYVGKKEKSSDKKLKTLKVNHGKRKKPIGRRKTSGDLNRVVVFEKLMMREAKDDLGKMIEPAIIEVPVEAEDTVIDLEEHDFDEDNDVSSVYEETGERGVVRFTLRVARDVFRKLENVEFYLIGATKELNDWKIGGNMSSFLLSRVDTAESFCYKSESEKMDYFDIYWLFCLDLEIDLPLVNYLEYKFVMKSKKKKSPAEYQVEIPRKWKCRKEFSLGRKGTYFAPVNTWMDSLGHHAEHKHTSGFYISIRKHKYIHFNQISSRIWIGTAPRNLEHVSILKTLGITCAINFQDQDDVMQLSPDIEKWYMSSGILYIWLPTQDFSRDSKRIMIPHASYIIKGLMENNHRLYVHCNAGVGRSVAAVCGYFLNCKRMALNEIGFRVVSKRSVSYISLKALRGSMQDYQQKFSPIV